MDSVTQAVLGASIGEAVLGKKIGRKAAVFGGIIGTLPDLDILLVPFLDELQKISVHRGYSHSLIFCILAPFLIAYILQCLKWTKNVSFERLWIFSFLALLTHVILDAFTSFGTQLFLPVSDLRVSLDSISIVDPVYTIPLLTGLLVSLFRKDAAGQRKRTANSWGLVISSLYLAFTLANKHHIESVFERQLDAQGIAFNDLLTVPVRVGNMVWYGVAKNENNLYIGKYAQIKNNQIDFEAFPVNDHLLAPVDDYLVDRMKWFAQGFYTVAEKDGKIRMYNMQCDMQGIRKYGSYRAPTAFYYEITPLKNGLYDLRSGMHDKGTIE